MKNDLRELQKVDEEIKLKLQCLKNSNELNQNYVNEVKILKNCIFEKTSKFFIYNLRKLIQIEETQKKLAKKIGVSEDLISKYKSGEAFPSIETLLYICQVYNITLERFLGAPLNTAELESLLNTQESESEIFEDKYYAYFLVTNLSREGAIHEGIIEFEDNNVIFKITSHNEVIKYFTGTYSINDKLIAFNLSNTKEGTIFINMIKPYLSRNKYLGGSALLVLPSDANSKPCAQKIIFSRNKVDREKYYEELRQLLCFHADGAALGNVKISHIDDEHAYNFIRKQERK